MISHAGVFQFFTRLTTTRNHSQIRWNYSNAGSFVSQRKLRTGRLFQEQLF